MNQTQAKQYLAAAVATETGKQALRALGFGGPGFGAVIAAPTAGDDTSSVKVAELLREKLQQSYGF